ncbi:hypothetical protein LTR78_004446 [Recurvomyces mirabilis]|uniref:Methyltransferase type 11 domain-containing protein n=1 Tax=Recurvomyces mirabilis TaxID=574656 RepID=A0AAE1C2T0_9PEZI|nr:hypothetical protein LTR78_004446 [Recurvomyces mirabilis]KAK5155888.1 hypothetical protein LTS14_005454 [Recurvomyces mirabilis]
MSASFRSHFRSTPSQRTSEKVSEEQRKRDRRTSTALTPAVDATRRSDQNEAVLTKRASRSITPIAGSEHGTRSSSRAATTVPAIQQSSTAGRRLSVAPPSEDGGPGSSAPSGHRHIYSPPPHNVRTPSLFSGSSASTFDSPRSNVLRKKPSMVDGQAIRKPLNADGLGLERATMSSRNESRHRVADSSVLGMLPPSAKFDDIRGANNRSRSDSRNFATPPLATLYAPSATPSTRYTDSPFSHIPTPSSASTYSPAVLATSDISSTMRPESPARKRSSFGRKQDHGQLGLPPVRESSTSSSNSTIKPGAALTSTKPNEIHQHSTAARPLASSRTPSYAKPTASTAARKVTPPVQVPPELAHLNVDTPRKPSLDKPLPPLRPSRDGTPSLPDIYQQSRVVQSDLPTLYTTYHKRTPSQETPVSASSPGFRQRFGLTSKSSSRQPSPRIDSAISPPPSARLFARGPTPDLQQWQENKLRRQDSPAVGPAPSPSKSPRFAFLSRKPKADSNRTTEKPKRELKKGPVAGTGHEGYGRFGARGRSGSVASSTGIRSPSADSEAVSVPHVHPPRKSSVASSGDSSEVEDFIRERQKPMVLRGSGSTYSVATSTSEVMPASRHDSSNSSSVDSYRLQLLPSAMQGAHGGSPVKRPLPPRRLPSDSSEDDMAARYPSLATRRSLTRLPPFDTRQVNMPAPINTNLPTTRQPMDSDDTKTSATDLRSDESMLCGNRKYASPTPKQIPSAETKPSRKWNFFQRAQASPRSKGKGKALDRDYNMLESGERPYDHVAPYAMLDAEEPLDLSDVQRILQQADSLAEESASEDHRVVKVVPYEHRHSSLLPSPPGLGMSVSGLNIKVKPSPPKLIVPQSASLPHKVTYVQSFAPKSSHVPAASSTTIPHQEVMSEFRKPEGSEGETAQITPEMRASPFLTSDNPSDDSPRQPRLSPVGRIPRVVSRRDRDRKLPDVSFSRPFVNTQPRPTVKPPGALYNQIRELASPIEPNSQPTSSTSAQSDGLAGDRKSSLNTEPPSVSTNRTSMEMTHSKDFSAFTPRKNSDVSYTNTSSSTASWMASLVRPGLQLDDHWAEYNDLLDDMLPQRTPLSTGSSLGAPFQYSSMLYNTNSPALPIPLYYSQPPSTELPAPPRSHTVPAVLSVPQQIARFMQPSMSPLATPHTLSDLYETYGSQSTTQLVPSRASLPPPFRESATKPNRTSLPSARASTGSSTHSRFSVHSRSASVPDANNNIRNSVSSLTASARFKRDTQLLDIAEDDGDSQVGTANLRFAALMTSKWLSFGQVMFSPAQNMLSNAANEPKVLILDGLGSDWSYYVALTYPGVAVHNLGPGCANGSTSWPGIYQKPPANHRHYPLSSISAVFPFPKGWFTAVSLRFPVAAPDSAYQACISECKRVLRPGGHLEVVTLDLDLVNMGSKARSLVRGLKTRMQSRDPDVSLRNVSDVFVRMIGRRGFEEVQRCIVGVPAAGRIPSSRDISSRGSSDEASKRRASRDNNKNRSDSSDQDFNFQALLEDARSNNITKPHKKSDDENITKMVAKVGRWWYSTCYESAMPSNDRSIWNDHALLRECEKQGTSFRLLICHAQKPAQARRRTVSV